MASLATMKERIRNTPGLFRDVTTLAACVVVGLVCSGYILSHQDWQPPWEDRYEFSAEFDKAPAVRPESLQEVRIAGVQVGRITAAEPTAAGLARVTMAIDPEHTVYENARVVIRTKSPLNVMYATLDPGGPPAAELAEGSTIPITQTDRAVQPNEILDNLDTRARAGLTSLLNEADVALAAGPENLGRGLHDTQGAMDSFQPVLTELETRRANIRRLVTAMSGISEAIGDDDERLAELTDASHTALAALAARDQELSATLAQLPGFTSDLRRSMRSVDTLSTELDPALGDLSRASEELPGAVRDLTGTVAAIRQFVDGAAPVVDRAGPVVRDLRPLVGDARVALGDLAPTTADLPSATARLVPWMEDLAAFVYQTSSSFSLYDANGGLGRANLNVDLTNPSGGLQDEGISGSGGTR